VKPPRQTVQLPDDGVPVYNAGAWLLDGIRAKVRAEAKVTAQEAETRFRGGSTGLLHAGVSTGKCTREAAARYLGAEPPRDEEKWALKQLMFEAGHQNESLWYNNVIRSWPGVILREEEFPIKWELDGYTGTGREDFIFCTDKGIEEPLFLCEHKLESSLGSIKETFLIGQPKLDHCIQIANYMRHTALPGELWYTFRADMSLPEWTFITEHLPRDVGDTKHPLYRYIEFSGAGKPTKITPHLVGYRLRWHEGHLYWAAMNTPNDWNKTIITSNGIDAFGRSVIHMIEAEEMPPRPKVFELDGTPGRYNKCAYCDWATICDEAGDDFDRWKSMVDRRRTEALED
jgi:hypothetical protein